MGVTFILCDCICRFIDTMQKLMFSQSVADPEFSRQGALNNSNSKLTELTVIEPVELYPFKLIHLTYIAFFTLILKLISFSLFEQKYTLKVFFSY